MTTVWLAVAAAAVASFALKAVGPLLLAGRDLPPRSRAVITLVAPALLAGFVALGALSQGRHVTVDARTAGVAVAGVALALRAPMLLALVLGAATAALLRL